MDQFVDIIVRQVKDWGTIIDALDPFEVLVVNEFNHKTGPTYLPENIWALSFEELMRDYFCPQGYNASNPSCAIGICLTSYHVDDPDPWATTTMPRQAPKEKIHKPNGSQRFLGEWKMSQNQS